MRRFLIPIVFLLFVFGIFYYLTAWSYSDGERAGTISKYSRRGYVFKTWEGVLNVGGFSGETGSLTPQYFDFSVKDDSVAQQINQAVKTGQRVTLHYEEKLVKLPWNGETKYFVTGVEIVDPQYRYGVPGQPVYPNQPAPQTPPAQQSLPAPVDTLRGDTL
ncbi:hypothetical protein GCM10028803_46090 [Larkinella knui]|uniref:6-phosphogluconate dehydrogenase n=1 Tax=Larkinella knui TaxID=2025310 RepID=A0A3P1CPP2_9BACT|nr:hypothetical protein [Larkinella knui]RRB15208.1 hypothetical protein EHT87_11735 [Larkinella knui]